jgi:hypothetical protein
MKRMNRKSLFCPLIPLEFVQGSFASLFAKTYTYCSSLFAILMRFILLASAETIVNFRSW